MTRLAIIGGSGFAQLPNAVVVEQRKVSTPYGQPSAPLSFCNQGVTNLIFLPRHGDNHAIAPHQINYRANIYALKDAGVTNIIALAAVGGINPDFPARSIAIPHQIIDYTSARQHTFYEGTFFSNSRDSNSLPVNRYLDMRIHHIDFTEPYDRQLRARLIQAAQHVLQRTAIKFNDSGVYAVTQGPRLETAAEIDRLERDGADIVGMTAMPEAALARELNIGYAGIAMVVNAAAGRGDEALTMESIDTNLVATTDDVLAILKQFISLF